MALSHSQHPYSARSTPLLIAAWRVNLAVLRRNDLITIHYRQNYAFLAARIQKGLANKMTSPL